MQSSLQTTPCPNCGREIVSINGDVLSDSCPYCNVQLRRSDDSRNQQTPQGQGSINDGVQFCPNCGSRITGNQTTCESCGYQVERGDDGSGSFQQQGNQSQQQVSTPQSDDSDDFQSVDPEMNSLLHLKDRIECWYCHYQNPFDNMVCEKCGWKLYAPTGNKEANEETKLMNQMNQDQAESCLIEGLKAFLGLVIQNKGNNQGYLRCDQCGRAQYHYTEFECPNCRSPTILQELRGVVNGEVENTDLIGMLSKYFPKFKIVKYTTSAQMRHDMISGAKIDLETAARETASVMEVAATFLQSVTESPTNKSEGNSNNNNDDTVDNSSGTPIFSFSWNGRETDDRVLDILPDLNEETNQSETPQQEEENGVVSEDQDTSMEDDDDWLNP